MLRAISFVLLLLYPPLPVLADEPPRIAPRPLASALHAMKAGRWDTARALAKRDGPAASTLIDWYYLQAGLGKPSEIIAFLDANPDWPGLEALRKRSEEEMTHAGFDDVLAFYANHPPQTGIGVLNLARALTARGQVGEAKANVVLAWRTMDLTTQEHSDFLSAYETLLDPHHPARLDMALWRGLRDVEVMLPLVPEAERELAQIRQAIRKGAGGIDTRIKELTKAQKANPGIAYETFNRHIKKQHSDEAIALILSQSQIRDGLGQPQRWAGWRRALARAQMREGNAQLAYDLASVHQLVEGSAFADLEWLSGYLALTYLDAPELALDHFQRFRGAVRSPISLGRAGYWIGRAQDALNDPEAAAIAYAQGAEHQTSFYGLLAAERAGLPFDPALAGTEVFPPWASSKLADKTVIEAAILILATGQLNLAERFIVHIASTLDRQGLGQLATLLEELEQPHLQVMLGKAAAKRGIVLPQAYYALHPMAGFDYPVPMELSLAIARRESEFDDSVVSGAGAQGLMQLMPGTARDVARDLDMLHDPNRVLSDWQYNATLGSTYLAQMSERFDGNIVMISAGYNAGPARPPKWIERFGDPRDTSADVVDWIEHIPFRETRNYVMRVAESLPVYRARLGKDPLPVPFSRELTGDTFKPTLQ